jgi:hypothetical protein
MPHVRMDDAARACLRKGPDKIKGIAMHAELMWTPGLHDDPANKFLAAIFPPKADEPTF